MAEWRDICRTYVASDASILWYLGEGDGEAYGKKNGTEVFQISDLALEIVSPQSNL